MGRAAVFDSLDVIERVRERQLTAAQLDGYLRDAEAALYRYQIERYGAQPCYTTRYAA